MIYSILFVLLTIAVYLGLKTLYVKSGKMWLNPIFTSVVVLIALLLLSHISYQTYMKGGAWLRYLLQPATVAFAIPLHRHFRLLRQNAVAVLSGLICGCIVAVSSTVLIANSLSVPSQIVRSLAPRSITTPIAMQASELVGGLPVLTAAFVIVTALCGLVIGPLVIRILRLKSKVAKGLLFGTGAHGIGTSRAFEMGSVEGAFSSLAMILSAIFTVIFVPWFVPWLMHF